MSTETSRKIDTRKLDEIIESYGSRKSNLIAILQKVQDEYRYLPEDALIYIGTKMEGLSPATVYGQMTTNDGLFSLETVSCLGACGLAPVCVINGKVYPQMTSDAIKVILETLLKEER